MLLRLPLSDLYHTPQSCDVRPAGMSGLLQCWSELTVSCSHRNTEAKHNVEKFSVPLLVEVESEPSGTAECKSHGSLQVQSLAQNFWTEMNEAIINYLTRAWTRT